MKLLEVSQSYLIFSTSPLRNPNRRLQAFSPLGAGLDIYPMRIGWTAGVKHSDCQCMQEKLL